MNEYTVLYLNGIQKNIMAEDWKDSIREARSCALKGQFQDKIKIIIDDENNIIQNIDTDKLTFKFKL